MRLVTQNSCLISKYTVSSTINKISVAWSCNFFSKYLSIVQIKCFGFLLVNLFSSFNVIVIISNCASLKEIKTWINCNGKFLLQFNRTLGQKLGLYALRPFPSRAVRVYYKLWITFLWYFIRVSCLVRWYLAI